jgi:hypothetical protein
MNILNYPKIIDKAAEYWIQALKLADNYPGARNWLKVMVK